MKKSFLFLMILMVLAACSKNKSVAKKMGGDWINYKILKDDGSVIAENTLYNFDESSGDGKTYVAWRRHYGISDSIVAQGTYLVAAKGVQVILRTDELQSIHTDTARMEDIDKKSMVIRINDGIFYFKPHGEGK